MKIHNWSDLRKKRFSPERLAKIDREVAEEVVRLNLRAVRELVGKTQAEAAEAADMTQSEWSKAERREDLLFSTLRRHIRALGGDVEIDAVFGDKRVRLHF